jgi:hypothetical protein
MVKAQQIERDGTKHGAVRTFTDSQWEYLKSTYGSKLRWEIVGEIPEATKQDIVEFPEIYSDPPDEVILEGESKGDLEEELNNRTKKEIIREYGLSFEDSRLSRKDLINKVLNKE